MRCLVSLTSALTLVCGTAFAAGPEDPVADTIILAPAPEPVSRGPALGFTIRAGAQTRPEYFGSDEYEVVPDFGFRLNFARLGGREVGSIDPNDVRYGFGLRGSFRSIPERDSDDYSELTGLDDIDAAYELGLGIGYTQPNYEVFADLRHGFGGHEGMAGELGANLFYRPSDQLTFSAGPRVYLGSDSFADTYFSVSPAEAAASGLAAYDADGGVLGAGVELGMTYQFNDDWGLEGAVGWQRLMNDAEDSPIVEQGERDQYTARLGLTRRFSLGF